ncbi:MAG: class I SAM-dependent methyltransferase [Clostridiales bacterium]|nr:class I SAM-dependent methyltransferase [Clostridiales bacterium]
MIRLSKLLECVGNCSVLADIGTDHAYLPIEAVRAGICEKAIACDINAGPLKIAKKNICKAGFSERIEARLGDGLNPLRENEADCVVIAGMGGMRIVEILKAAPKKIENAKLVLQPQHDLEELRRFLHSNMSNIISEKLAIERSRFYVVLTVKGAKNAKDIPWTDAEYFLGKIESPDLLLYLCEMRKKSAGYFDAITDEGAREKEKKRLEWIEEKILCLQRNR